MRSVKTQLDYAFNFQYEKKSEQQYIFHSKGLDLYKQEHLTLG